MERPTAETSVVSFIGVHPTKTHVEGGNYYGDVIILNYLHVKGILILNTLRDNEMGPVNNNNKILIYSARQIKTSSRASCI